MANGEGAQALMELKTDGKLALDCGGFHHIQNNQNFRCCMAGYRTQAEHWARFYSTLEERYGIRA